MALIQMRICPAEDGNFKEKERGQVLGREEQLDRYYWGFQQLLNILPPDHNSLSLGPQMNNDFVIYIPHERIGST